MYDAIVIGGGPAGLAAALTLGRAHRKTLVLDSGDGRNAPAEAMHNFLTRDGTPPAEVRAIGRAQLGAYPAVTVVDALAVSVATVSGGYEVRLADDRVEYARRLLLASGLVDILPPVDGLAEIWGRSALHCPYCHGFEVSDRPIAVLGGDPDRIHLALHLSRFSSDVVLCTNGTEIEETHLATRTAPVTRLVSTGGKLEAIEFADGTALARDAVFVKTSWRQRSGLPAQLGCATFPDGTLEVNDFGLTSVPGIYAAGDMARRASQPGPMAAVIAAAASGTIAAVALDKDLLGADFDLPNPLAAKA
ncbi:NAD(P)/FAD-dependent oxidoreductase [Actinocrispum wychmicini]|uniref:Thioredoxin reductase n=1 Tax=Actinocrispum wychmicini TaxID=1213861 RepID=A0A4R2IXZ0_9PSEU|nr:NAD(P)/FAD-dependent oxidoreductase [Actinocrispum wychmicini]TCO49852.1 thioredoxin reductase [Actinocrispum wychmicini]